MANAAHPALILETRKTAPGLRLVDKWAVYVVSSLDCSSFARFNIMVVLITLNDVGSYWWRAES